MGRALARTDLEEFYAIVDLRAEDLAERLDDWQSHYNEFRVHGSLNGRTPWQVWYERARLTPLFEEVEALYNESVERIPIPIPGSTCSQPPIRNSETTVFRRKLCPHSPEIFRFAPGYGPTEIDSFPPYAGPKIGARFASPQSSVFRFGIA